MAKDPARRKRVVAASPEQPCTAPAGIEPGQRRLPTRRDTARPGAPRYADAPTTREPGGLCLGRKRNRPEHSTIEAARLRGPQTWVPACSTARGTPRTGHHPAGVPAGTGPSPKGRRRRFEVREGGEESRSTKAGGGRASRAAAYGAGGNRARATPTPDPARHRASGRPSLCRRADDPRTGRPLPRSETEPAGALDDRGCATSGSANLGAGVQHRAWYAANRSPPGRCSRRNRDPRRKAGGGASR